MSLDRIDNDGHYEIGNLRWAMRSEQQRNRRPNKLTNEQVVEAVRRYGAGEPLAPIAADMGVTYQSMWSLLKQRTLIRPAPWAVVARE